MASQSPATASLGQGGPDTLAPKQTASPAYLAALLDSIKNLIATQSQTGNISISGVTLTPAYDFNALMKDIENYQAAQRRQRGIYT